MIEPCTTCGKQHTPGRCPESATLATQLAISHETIVSSDGAPPAGLTAPPEMPAGDLETDSMVGEYRVVRRVGEGGMGAVYEGVHPLIGRKVAIKVINAAAQQAQGASARFLQEARAASMVRHRNIVDVFAFGQLRDGRSYLVMEFLEGQSLGHFLHYLGPLSFAQALPILDGILAGLRVAHDKGIVHRDLKPENIWIVPPEDAGAPGDDGSFPDPARVDAQRIKLLDFGLAKLTELDGSGDARLTRAGVPIGTPAFMSPEQCKGLGEIDHRSDLYSLGIIMYEMFSSDVPFSGESLIEVLHLQLTGEPASLSGRIGMPDDLDAVIRRTLAKDPEDRYQTAAALRAALFACDDAREWSPRPADARDAAQPTIHGEIDTIGGLPGEDEGPFPSLRADSYRVHPRREASTLTLTFRGELDGPAIAHQLGGYLGSITGAMEEHRVRRVVLDLAELTFLSPEGVACLGEWLSLLCELRSEGLAPSTLRYSEGASWQHHVAEALQRVDGALMLDAVE